MSSVDKIVDSEWTAVVEQMVAVGRQLPQCGDAARLRVLVSRLQSAIVDGGDVESALSTLAEASARALEDDAWLQLDRLVQHLKASLRPVQ
jgi:hypothetical protein